MSSQSTAAQMPFPIIDFYSKMPEDESWRVGDSNRDYMNIILSFTLYMANCDVAFYTRVLNKWLRKKDYGEKEVSEEVIMFLALKCKKPWDTYGFGFGCLQLMIDVARELEPTRKFDLNDSICAFVMLGLRYSVFEDDRSWDTQLLSLEMAIRDNTKKESPERQWCTVIEHLRRFRLTEEGIPDGIFRAGEEPKHKAPIFPEYDDLAAYLENQQSNHVETIKASRPKGSLFSHFQRQTPPVDNFEFVDKYKPMGGLFLLMLTHWTCNPEFSKARLDYLRDTGRVHMSYLIAKWFVQSADELKEYGDMANFRRVLKEDFLIDVCVSRFEEPEKHKQADYFNISGTHLIAAGILEAANSLWK